MMPEMLDRRILGAVRFLDAATMGKIGDSLLVDSPVADLRKNRSGLWVIWNVPGLEAHTAEFDQPPGTPALGSIQFTVQVADPAGRYLSRAATIHVPRDPSPSNVDQAGSLFQPVDVPMYPSPSAPLSPGWAVIRAHVKDATTGAALAGALLRVLRTSDNQVMARGMSDARGEALVVIPGIPVTTFNTGNGPVLATEIDVNVEAIFDPGAGAITDPDAIEGHAGLPSISSAQKIAAGRTVAVELAVTV